MFKKKTDNKPKEASSIPYEGYRPYGPCVYCGYNKGGACTKEGPCDRTFGDHYLPKGYNS